jgi:dihydrofolate reductase
MNSLTAIACMASNRVIGSQGGIPWRHLADLRFFKAETVGRTVIMGRRTWKSLPGGGPLKRRRNIVLSRYLVGASGAEVAPDLRGLEMLLRGAPAFVIGGAEIYRLLMPWTTEVLLTVLDAEHEGDTFMPEFESEFGPPEILERVPGVEWRRYVRKTEGGHP